MWHRAALPARRRWTRLSHTTPFPTQASEFFPQGHAGTLTMSSSPFHYEINGPFGIKAAGVLFSLPTPLSLFFSPPTTRVIGLVIRGSAHKGCLSLRKTNWNTVLMQACLAMPWADRVFPRPACGFSPVLFARMGLMVLAFESLCGVLFTSVFVCKFIICIA